MVAVQIIHTNETEEDAQLKGYKEWLTFHYSNTPVSDGAPFVLWCGDCGLHSHFVTDLYMGGRTLWWESWKNKQHMLKDWEKTCCRDFPSTVRFLLQHFRITPAHQVARCGCIGPSTFLLSAASHTARSGHEVRLCPALSLSRHLRHTLPRTFCNTLPSSPPEEKSPIHQTAVTAHQSSYRTSSKGCWSYLNVLSHVHSIIIIALEIWSLLKRLAFSHHCSWRLMSHT